MKLSIQLNFNKYNESDMQTKQLIESLYTVISLTNKIKGDSDLQELIDNEELEFCIVEDENNYEMKLIINEDLMDDIVDMLNDSNINDKILREILK